MSNITISETEDRLLISISKAAAGAEILRGLAEKIRFEELSSNANYDEKDILELGNEIKQQWWEKNKVKIERDIESFAELNDQGE